MELLDQAEPGYGAFLPASARDAIDAYTTLGIEVETGGYSAAISTTRSLARSAAERSSTPPRFMRPPPPTPLAPAPVLLAR